MIKEIKFNKIIKETIFCEDFIDFNVNNSIKFSNQGIAVLYGPNGTGKTSLAKVLNSDNNGEYHAVIEGQKFTEKNIDIFHVIADQNTRNIIKGNTKDFLLGDNIRKEYELQEFINSSFEELIQKNLIGELKNNFKISKKTHYILETFPNYQLKGIIEDIVNTKSKGKKIDKEDFFKYTFELKENELEEYEQSKFDYIIEYIDQKDSALRNVLKMKLGNFNRNEQVKEIEENSFALKVLNKFSYKEDCVVCDHENINVIQLISKKEENKALVIGSLNKETQKIFEGLDILEFSNDPFLIKEKIIKAVEDGEIQIVIELQEDVRKYIKVIQEKLSNLFANCVSKELFDKYNEYLVLINDKPLFSDEDILFIEKVVSENIGKDIVLKRDDNKNLILLLDNKEFLNKDRDSLHLSNGEQNFISLAFEFLKAKNSSSKIVILDDPISSFDSIFKNKIAFSIVKLLEGKNQIVLTHNTDLIKLLEHQLKQCFNLYIFNNTPDEENGFLNINRDEQDILLHLNKLLDFFRSKVFYEIANKEHFLLSMIPFMRGYAQIINLPNEKNQLTQLMHGYNDIKIDLVKIFNSLFVTSCSLIGKFEITAKDISDFEIDNLSVFHTTTLCNA
ncbi:AAA family ATPase [Paenisporosarcina macmurdoensis]|uniref:AAA family ATPase n=1 Tax=Paenisporosarcina macmurdoensis TaxID=212659 RepID=A0ABW1L8P1_9BACL